MKSKTIRQIGTLINIFGVTGLLVSALFLLSDLHTLTSYLKAQGISSPIGFNPLIYILVAATSAVCAFSGLAIVTRSPFGVDEEPVTDTNDPSGSVLSAYKDLFAQYVDPIGNLHLWRVEAERNNKDIDDAIRYVRELEEYLERKCDITRVGELGEEVAYDPKLHYARPEVPAGTRVEIIAPGWKWRGIPLRYPTVR